MEEYFDGSLPLFQQVRKQMVIEKAVRPDSERAAEKRRRLLERLKNGPLSCVDCESMMHRGQAVIRELRQRGHHIETIRSVYYYRGGPDTEIVKTSKDIYEAYLSTSHWRTLAKQRKEYDDWKCVQCKTADDVLHTHHWRYDLFNEDIQNDLCTLCQVCHDVVHELASGSSIHFPHYLPASVVEKIRIESGADI